MNNTQYFVGLAKGKQQQWVDDQTAILDAQLAEQQAREEAAWWHEQFIQQDAQAEAEERTS